jgi:hypothetical protein
MFRRLQRLDDGGVSIPDHDPLRTGRSTRGQRQSDLGRFGHSRGLSG